MAVLALSGCRIKKICTPNKPTYIPGQPAPRQFSEADYSTMMRMAQQQFPGMVLKLYDLQSRNGQFPGQECIPMIPQGTQLCALQGPSIEDNAKCVML